MSWLRHAFALDPAGPTEPTEDERPIIERVCQTVVRRRMNVPAAVFLEMSRPLNRLAAQALYFFRPVASMVLTSGDYDRFARFLERSGSFEYLCRRIEELAADAASPTPQSSVVPASVAPASSHLLEESARTPPELGA
jgi:hypothetical protein